MKNSTQRQSVSIPHKLLFQQVTANTGQATLSLDLPMFMHMEDQIPPIQAGLSAGHDQLDALYPQEGDLIPFKFRLLSAAYLGAGGYHLDFAQGDALEQAVALFRGPEMEGSKRSTPLVVVRDHSFKIEDRLGFVHAANWSDANEAHDLVAPGIDAELHINWKLAGDVVRRLLHDPPLLESCSVSLSFNWAQSHMNMEDWQFWMHLGEEIDDEIVRVIVTEILSIEHVGLVFAGADPSARRQPAELTAMAHASLAAAVDEHPAQINNLPALLGLEGADQAAIEVQVEKMLSMANIGERALSDLRNEVRTLIIQLDGVTEEYAANAMHPIIDVADMGTLKALKTQYARQLETLLPAKCQNCGETHIQHRSSKDTGLEREETVTHSPEMYR